MKIKYTCSASGLPVLDEEEHFKICHACRSAKYFLQETIMLIIVIVVLFFIAGKVLL